MAINTKNMTAQDLIKTEIIIGASNHNRLIPDITYENINDIFDELSEDEAWEEAIYDSQSSMRESGDDCNLRCNAYSNHYECEQVAYKVLSGEWVSWTYWFGGGKHADPDSIDWISDAYLLDVVETSKIVIHREFTKK